MSFEDYVNSKETREKLIKERALLSAYPIANQSKIKVIDELLASLPNDEDYEEERGCATYLFSNDEPEKVYEESIPEEPKLTFKEKASNSLGAFGSILFFIIRIIVAILPFVMIGGNFFLTLLLISINTFVPFTSVVFWIWGLVCAIKGVQDIWAIIFYISFVLIWIPFFISTITSMFSKK